MEVAQACKEALSTGQQGLRAGAEVVAFALGGFSSMPAVRNFSICAALAVFLDFCLQVSDPPSHAEAWYSQEPHIQGMLHCHMLKNTKSTVLAPAFSPARMKFLDAVHACVNTRHLSAHKAAAHAGYGVCGAAGTGCASHQRAAL
jgi:hypothetical protein